MFMCEFTCLVYTSRLDLQASDSDCMDSVGVHLTSPAVPMTVVGIDCLEEFLQEAQGSLQSNITGRGSPDTQSKGLSDKNQSTTSSEKSHKILKLPKAAVAKSVEHATKKYGPKIVHRPMTPCKSERGIKQKHIVNRGKRRCKSVNTIVTVDESINKDVSTLKGKRDIKGYSSDFFDVLCRPISYFRHCDGHGTITSPSLEVAGFICSGLDSVSTCSSSSLQKINFSDQTNNSVTQQRVDMTPVDNPTNSTIRNDVTAGVKSSPFKRNLNLSPIEHDNATSDLYCEEPKRKVRGHLTGKTKHTTANQSCGIKRVCDESKVIIAEKFSTLPKNDIAVDLHNTAKATNHIDPAVGINTRIRCLKTDGPTAVKVGVISHYRYYICLCCMCNISSTYFITVQ